MKTHSFNSLLAGAVLLAGGAMAQLFTTTLPFLDGDTLVLSTGTNALGVPVTQTVRTVTATALVTTVPTLLSSSSSSIPRIPTALISSSSSSSSRAIITSTSSSRSVSTSRSTATLGAAPTTDQGMRVGQDTALPPPMRTTTYWYDTGNGYWTVATWTASVTRAPTVATVIPSAGTLQDYAQYQTSVNSNVLASAQASATRNAGQSRAQAPSYQGGGWVGWGIMGVGAVAGAAVAL